MDKLKFKGRGSTTPKDPAKKLKEFYDPNTTQLKKFKSLVGFCESAGSTEEVKALFEKEAYNVWSVFLDTFQFYEQKASAKEGKDVEKLLLILKRILVYLPQKIKEKWQIRSIANILEKILYKENKLDMRVQGMELLLLFLEDLETPDVAQQGLFASALPLEVFEATYTSKKIILPRKSLSAPDPNMTLIPTTTPCKIEDVTSLLDVIMEFIVTHNNSFDLLWNLFKQHYLTIFYPEVCKEIGILDRFSDIGFPGMCPPEVQATIISHLQALLNVEVISQKMWGSKENTAILLEICRQSCILPMEYVETVKKSVTFFRKIFLGTKSEPIPKVLLDQPDRLKSYQRFYIEQMPNIFKIESKSIGAEQQVTICLEIFELFKQTFDMMDSLAPEIRDVVLFTLLEITTALLKPDNPNQELAKSLAGVMVDTLLLTWISSKTTNVNMWARLQEALQSLFHRIEPVVQTKLKLLQLTLIINDFVYPNTVKKKKFQREVSPEKAAKVADATIPEKRRTINVARDPALGNIPWDFETAYFTWNAILKIFYHMNKIKDPVIHSEAVGCISDVIDILLHAEAKAAMEQLTPSSSIKPISLLQTFGQYLFEACTLHDKYYDGKTKAIGALCRILVRHYTIFPGSYPQNLLPNFYTTLHSALVNPPAHNSTLLPWCILENSFNIFNLALPGSSVLIPYYLIEVKKMLRQNPPADLRMNGLTILASLICYASQYGELVLPMQFYGHLQKAKAKDSEMDSKMTFSDIRDRILDILQSELQSTKDIEVISMCLCSMGTMLADMFTSATTPTKNLIDLVKTILNYITYLDWNVSLIALDMLALLAPIYLEKSPTDQKALFSIVKMIVESQCTTLQNMVVDFILNKTNDAKEKIIQQSYFALADWIMTIPSLTSETTLLDKLFYTAQAAVQSATTVELTQTLVTKEDMKTFRRKKKAEPEPAQPEDTTPKKPTPTLQDAGRYLLCTLLNFHRTFPAIQGVEFSSSAVTEPDDSGFDEAAVTHYVYNNDTLLSFVEIGYPENEAQDKKNKKFARVFLRDFTGKYSWDAILSPITNKIEPEKAYPIAVKTPAARKDSLKLLKENITPYPERIPGKIILWDELDNTVDCSTVDKIDEMLQYLSETSDVEKSQPLNIPTLLPQQYLPDLITAQNEFIAQKEEDRKTIEDIRASSAGHTLIPPPEEPVPQHNFHNSRTLLSHLGFLDASKVDDLKLIDNSKQFQLKLKNLDKSHIREMIKLGLLYIKNGQDDQGEILKNDSGSPQYNEFVRSLGWTVNVANHKGYNAGLDPAGSNGEEAAYFANQNVEIMFHEVVRMPTNTADPQQLLKKRHVGNDPVHIIWSEHSRDYSPKTITSQFNDAHIIIYPLPNGLYRVQIAKKPKVPFFGPLVHGMTVTKKLLPLLVLRTAVNAYRYIRYTSEGYERPFFNRLFLMNEIINKHSLQPEYQELLKGPMLNQENKSFLLTSTPASPTFAHQQAKSPESSIIQFKQQITRTTAV